MSLELEPTLVPELLVKDLNESLSFWKDLCGFEVLYSRPDEGFAYMALGSAHVMLEQAGVGRNWLTGNLDRPFGRGINFQISVPDAEALVSHFDSSGWPLFMALEEKWYEVGGEEACVRQFLVQDPDGYLIRFQSSNGRRPLIS